MENLYPSIDAFIKEHRQSELKSSDFVAYLYQLMEKHGFTKSSDLYKKANITKQTWSNIVSGKVQPNLPTILRLVFALELNNRECKYLLKKAGYTLASSSKQALVIRYCISNKIYDLYAVDAILAHYGYPNYLF